jgi:hypothetical protein
MRVKQPYLAPFIFIPSAQYIQYNTCKGGGGVDAQLVAFNENTDIIVHPLQEAGHALITLG